MNSTLLKVVAAFVVAIAASLLYLPPFTEIMAFILPSKTALAEATASNSLYKPKSRPVGVFLGGTSGIGQAMAEQLASQTNGRARIVLLGRNQAAAEKIIAGLPKTPASTPAEDASDYSFIKVDATSMAEVRAVTTRLSRELDKVNFVVTTAGFLTTKGRSETSEGLDRKMACNFYARFRTIYDLLPLVEKAAERGEQTGVVSVLSAGHGGPIDTNDLGLVKTYTLKNALSHAIVYKDTAFEKLAQLHPKIGFYHLFPGGVSTPMVTSYPGAKLLLPLFRWMIVTPQESAQIMWWRAWSTEPTWNTGAHQINQRGEEIPAKQYVNSDQKKAIWEHALSATS